MAKRVLVIDDSEILLEVTVNALKAAGYDALRAVDLASLDQALDSGPVDLILVDVNMPEMFGDDVVEFLRSQHKTAARLLLFSDLPEPELAERARASGADGYVVKGHGIEATVATVRSHLGGESVAGGRILIVGAHGAAIQSQEELSARGFEVHIADDKEKATRVILKKQTRPDLVVVDLSDAKVDGAGLCGFIKANPLFSGIKVLVFAKAPLEEGRRRSNELGADGFVPDDGGLPNAIAAALA